MNNEKKKLNTYRDKCIHFNGIGLARSGKKCKSDVDYRALVGGPDLGWALRIPCLDIDRLGDKAETTTIVPCSSRRWMTLEDHLEQEAKLNAEVDRLISNIESGKCNECGADVEPSRVIGRCKYAACGHRVGQVEL